MDRDELIKRFWKMAESDKRAIVVSYAMWLNKCLRVLPLEVLREFCEKGEEALD